MGGRLIKGLLEDSERLDKEKSNSEKSYSTVGLKSSADAFLAELCWPGARKVQVDIGQLWASWLACRWFPNRPGERAHVV